MSEPTAAGQVVDLASPAEEGRCKTAPLREYRERCAVAPAVGALSCNALFRFRIPHSAF